MGLLIDGLMELSRVGHTGVNPARIDTSALLHELMGTHMADMAAGRQIEWNIAPDFPPVSGDPVLIRQIWSKLLSNALKYTRSRAVARIGVSCALANHGLCVFHIKDNEVGFNPRFKEKLFKVSQRLP